MLNISILYYYLNYKHLEDMNKVYMHKAICIKCSIKNRNLGMEKSYHKNQEISTVQ